MMDRFVCTYANCADLYCDNALSRLNLLGKILHYIWGGRTKDQPACYVDPESAMGRAILSLARKAGRIR